MMNINRFASRIGKNLSHNVRLFCILSLINWKKAFLMDHT